MSFCQLRNAHYGSQWLGLVAESDGELLLVRWSGSVLQAATEKHGDSLPLIVDGRPGVYKVDGRKLEKE